LGPWRSGLLLGKLIPYALVGVLETCIVLTAMVYVFDVAIVGGLALLLTPGELMDSPLAKPLQSHPFKGIVRQLFHLFFAHPASSPQPECHVVQHIHHREQRQVLEDHVAWALVRWDIVDPLPSDEDVPGGRYLEAGDHAQKGGLAAARWA
jgi:hypothetical protein